MSRRFAAFVVALLSLSSLNAQALPLPAGIIPVAGSTAGANGARFRTSLQLNNPTDAPLSGAIVFRPAGRQGSDSDPIMPFELAPRQTLSWADVVATIGATGLGSIDIFTAGPVNPIVVARAYDDGGAAGTKGVTVPLLRPADAATKGQLLTLIAPANAERSRFNIGIRTLGDGARLRFLVFSADGSTRVAGNEESLPPHTFEQRGAAAFTNAPIGPNESVGILVLQGSVLAYGTMTDNRTNDPSIQLAEQHNSVPIAFPSTLRIGDSAAPFRIVLQASDADDEALLFSIAGQPAQGTLGALERVNAHEAAITFTRNATFDGADSFVFHVEDENGGSSEATVRVIRGGSQPAVTDNVSVTTPRDQPVLIPLHCTNPSGESLAFVVTSGPAHGTHGDVVTTGPCSATTLYTPAPGFTGTDFFDFAATDGDDLFGARATITVTAPAGQNHAPTGSADSYTTSEDATLTIAAPGVLANDTDADHDALTATLVTPPAHGTVMLQADGSFTYSPIPDYFGFDSFTYRITDGQALSGDVTVDLTVGAVNDPPSFAVTAPTVTVLEDSGAATIAEFASAIDNEPGQSVHFNVTSTNAALFSVQPSIDTSGALHFTVAPDANGTADLTITLQDDAGGDDTSDPRHATIVITAVNDVPAFAAGADVTVAEDAGAQSFGNWASFVSAGPANEGAQQLTFVVAGNTNPALFAAGPAVAANGTLTFTSAANANGSATITLALHDDSGTTNGGSDTSAPQSFTIHVTAVNDAPSYTLAASPSVAEDAGAQSVASFATAISPGPADEASQTVAFVLTNDNNALFTSQPALAADGTLTYTPAADAFGTATVTVVATDSAGASAAPRTFAITIAPVNDTPSFAKGTDVASDEDAGPQTTANWATAINAGAANESAQTLSFHVTANTNPSLFAAAPAISSTGTLTYTSAPNASGSATITLMLQDDGGGADTSAPQSFTITINTINDVPAVNAATFAIDENSANGTSVGTATYGDPDLLQNHTFAITGGNTGGAFAIDATTGVITVASQAALDLETSPSFALTVTVTDDGVPVQAGSATITVNLRDLNEAPVASNASLSVNENSPNGTLVGTVTASDVDAGQTLTYTIASGNAAGVFALNAATGQITVANSALLDFESTAAYTLGVTVTDSAAAPLSANATISIAVNDINDPPSALALTGNTVVENLPAGTAVGTLSTTDQDAGDTHTYTLVAGTGSADNALFQIAGNQLQTAAPLDFETRPSASIRVRTTDAAGAPFEQQFMISITNANDPPVAVPDSNSVTEDDAATTATGNVLGNDSDVDPANTLHVASVSGSAANLGASVSGTYGSVVIDGAGGYTYTIDNTLPAVQALAAGQSMPDAFAYEAADPSNALSPSTLTITVHGANDAPSFSSSAPTTVDEDSLYSYNVAAADVDTTNALVITATTKPAWLTLVDHGNRTATLSGTPANGDVGSHDVTLDVFDGTTHVQQSFTIVVANTNDAPIGVDDLFSFTEDSGTYTVPFGSFNVLTNDSDPDVGDSIYVAEVNGNPDDVFNFVFTPYGTLELDDDGAFFYNLGNAGTNVQRLAEGATATDVINYTVADFHGAFSHAAVRIAIHGVNDAPVANDDTFGLPPAGTLHATSVLANDTDVDTVPLPDTLTPALLSTTTQGTLTFHADGTFDYVKTCGGACALDHDTFTYKINDGHVDSATATVTIRYNSPPVAANDAYAIAEDATLTMTAPGLRANDSDLDGDITNVIVVSQPSSGTLSPITTTALGDELPLDGSFTWVPDPDFNGPVTFTYKLRDAAGLESSVATVTINVNSVNDAPAFTIPASPNLTACSPSGTYVSGYATGITAGAANESGQHLTFVVTVDDPSLFESSGAPICVGGSGPNDPIYCSNNQIPHIDPNSGDLFFSIASGVSGSTGVHVVLHDDGGTANGGIADSPVQNFTITVAAPNNPPSFTPGPQFVDAPDSAGPQSIAWATAISANDAGQNVTFLTDLQSGAALFAAGGAPAISPTGVLTFTPAVGAQGTALVVVTLQDDGGTACGSDQSNQTNLFVTIGTPNHPPTFTLLQDPVNAAAGLAFSDLHNFVSVTSPGAGDTGQTPYTVSITQLTISNPSMFALAPTVYPESTTKFALRFVPSPSGATGTATYRITVQDAGGLQFGGSDTSTHDFTINLGTPNHAPIFFTSTGLTTPANAAPQTFPTFVTLSSPGLGDPDQSPYTGTLTQTATTNASLFSAGPTLTKNPDGVTWALTYTTATDQVGSATYTITIKDSGGLTFGGTDQATASFTISFGGQPNHVPIFQLTPSSFLVATGSGTSTYSQFVNVTSPGNADPAQTPYTVTAPLVTTNNPSLFSTPPTLTPVGAASTATKWDLSFTLNGSQTGTATFRLTVRDAGGTTFGGTDTATQDFTIAVGSPNHAPVFTMSPTPVNATVNQGITFVNNFVNVTSPGAGDPTQTPYFASVVGLISTTNQSLFGPGAIIDLQQGADTTKWNLRFLTSPNQIGSATFNVAVRDAAGTAFGGTDLAQQTFTINVTGTVPGAPAATASKKLSLLAFPNLPIKITNAAGDNHYRLLDDMTYSGANPPIKAQIVSYTNGGGTYPFGSGDALITVDDVTTGAFTYHPVGLQRDLPDPAPGVHRWKGQTITFRVCDSAPTPLCSSDMNYSIEYSTGSGAATVNMPVLEFHSPTGVPSNADGTAERPFVNFPGGGTTFSEITYVLRKGTYTLPAGFITGVSNITGEGFAGLSLASLGVNNAALPAGTVLLPTPLSTTTSDTPVVIHSGGLVMPGPGTYRNLIIQPDSAANPNFGLRGGTSNPADVFTVDRVRINNGAGFAAIGTSTMNITNSSVTASSVAGATAFFVNSATMNVSSTTATINCSTCVAIRSSATNDPSHPPLLTMSADSSVTVTSGDVEAGSPAGTHNIAAPVTVDKSANAEDGFNLFVNTAATLNFTGAVHVTTNTAKPVIISTGTNSWLGSPNPPPAALTTITMSSASNFFHMNGTPAAAGISGIDLLGFKVGAAGLNLSGILVNGVNISIRNMNQGTGTITLAGTLNGRAGQKCVFTDLPAPLNAAGLTTTTCTP